MLLRHYLEQGIPKAVLAAQLGVSRRTIHHWITTGQLDRDLDQEVVYTPRPAVPTKLDAYKPMLCTPIRRGTLGSVGLLPSGGSSNGNASPQGRRSSHLQSPV